MPEAIGGYFELELRQGHTLYPQALGFNSARSALRGLLGMTATRGLLLPWHVCNAVPEATEAAGVGVRRYGLDWRLELEQLPALQPDERLLYVNYFGLKGDYIHTVLAPHYGAQLVVDNSQALFSQAVPGIATLYSPRKFVGVPDGGWLVNAPSLDWPLPESHSQASFAALLGRLEQGPEPHYPGFQAVETALEHAPVAAMSTSTRRLLDSLDYPDIAARRKANFTQLHQALGNHNPLGVFPAQAVAALCYPLLTDSPGQAQALRRHLLTERIFTPCYWQEVASAAHSPEVERQLASRIVPLPVDQRYGPAHMARLTAQVATGLRLNSHH